MESTRGAAILKSGSRIPTPSSPPPPLMAGEFDADVDELVDPNDEFFSKGIDSCNDVGESTMAPPPEAPPATVFPSLSPWPSPESDDLPFVTTPTFLRASMNQSSHVGSWSSGSDRRGNKKNRSREGVPAPARRSYSSIMLARSSSVEMEIKESRSWLGNWYLRLNGLPFIRDFERCVVRVEREYALRRSIATMRVSPPA